MKKNLRQNNRRNFRSGFTLVETIVVVAIIGVLTTVIAVNINNSREKGKIPKAVQQIYDVKSAVTFFLDATRRYPADCSNDTGTCTAANDPFRNALGISGWSGPYTTVWSLASPWTGHIGYRNFDIDSDGITDHLIILDDDRPGTSSTNNLGIIPVASLTAVDKIIDDGNLATGKARGNGTWGSTGELILKLDI